MSVLLVVAALFQVSASERVPTQEQFEAMLVRFGDKVSQNPVRPLRRAIVHKGERLQLDELPQGTDLGPWVVAGFELHATYSLPAMLPRMALQQWARTNLHPGVQAQSHLSGAITVDEFVMNTPATESKIKSTLDRFASDLAAADKLAALHRGRAVDNIEALSPIRLDQAIVLDTLTGPDAGFLIRKSGWNVWLEAAAGGGLVEWRRTPTVDEINLVLKQGQWRPDGTPGKGFSIESNVMLTNDKMARWKKLVGDRIKWGRVIYQDACATISTDVDMSKGMSVAEVKNQIIQFSRRVRTCSPAGPT